MFKAWRKYPSVWTKVIEVHVLEDEGKILAEVWPPRVLLICDTQMLFQVWPNTIRAFETTHDLFFSFILLFLILLPALDQE